MPVSHTATGPAAVGISPVGSPEQVGISPVRSPEQVGTSPGGHEASRHDLGTLDAGRAGVEIVTGRKHAKREVKTRERGKERDPRSPGDIQNMRGL